MLVAKHTVSNLAAAAASLPLAVPVAAATGSVVAVVGATTSTALCPPAAPVTVPYWISIGCVVAIGTLGLITNQARTT